MSVVQVRLTVIGWLIVVLAACGGGGSSITPAVPQRIPGGADPSPGQRNQRLYVPNSQQDSIVVQDSGANGNAQPLYDIQGSQTELAGPVAVAVDSAGNLYAANTRCNCITEYASNASGNAAPIAHISGDKTGLADPQGIAVDSLGDIYVANRADSRVTVYAAGSTGNVTPIRTLEGSATGLCRPKGLTLAVDGTLYVVNTGNITSVTAYRFGASGDAAPLLTIIGALSGLQNPSGIAVTQTTAYVTNTTGGPQGAGTVTEYAVGSKNQSVPTTIIGGPHAALDKPAGIALDAAGNVYVSNAGTSLTVTVYAPSASGDTAPTRTLSGANTGIRSPGLIFVTGVAASLKYRVITLPASFSAAAISRSGAFVAGRMLGTAAIYHNGTVTRYGMLPGDDGSLPYAVNDAGYAVGLSTRTINAETTQNRPVRFMNGSVIALPGGDGTATALNNDNVAAGFTVDPASGNFRATLWSASNVAALPLQGFPQYTTSIINDLNNLDQYVGIAAGSETDIGFIGTGSTITPIVPPPSLTNVRGVLINDAGYIVTDAKFDTFYDRVFIRHGGQDVILNPFPGDYDVTASGINNSGQVVGNSSTLYAFHPYIFESGQMVDLNTLVSGVTLYQAIGIADNGTVLAFDRHSQYYLLVP